MEFDKKELELLVGALDNLVRQGGLNAAAQVLPLARKVEEYYRNEFGKVDGETVEAVSS